MKRALDRRIEHGDVETILPSASLREAAQRMEEEGLGSLVVADESGAPLGMLTDRDLALRFVGGPAPERPPTVADVMTHPCVTVPVDAGVDAVVDAMRRNGVRRIPLVADGRVVALVALDDLWGGLASELDDLRRSTRMKLRHARARGAFEKLHREIDSKLRDAYQRLQRTNWYARGALLGQIDELRDRLAHAVESGEDEDENQPEVKR